MKWFEIRRSNCAVAETGADSGGKGGTTQPGRACITRRD